MLYFTQGTMGLTALATAVLIWTGVIDVWHLVVLAAINGAVFAFNLPARQSLVPALVPEPQLANAMALTNSGTQLTRLIGPTLAGLLVAIPFVGTGGTFFLMFGLYVLVVGMLFQLHTPGNPEPHPEGESVLGAMADGFRFILGSKSIVLLFVMAILMVFLGQPYLTMMPVFASFYGVDAFGLGILLTAAGVGGLAGSLVVAYFSDARRKGLYQLLCAIGFGLSLIAFGLTANFWVALPLLVLTGVASTAMQVYNSTLIMLNTPQRLYGRVMAIYLMTFGLMPLSTLPLAAVTEAFGPQAMVIGCGIGMVVVAGIILVVAPNHRGDAPLHRPG
jgi:MFS family permease